MGHVRWIQLVKHLYWCRRNNHLAVMAKDFVTYFKLHVLVLKHSFSSILQFYPATLHFIFQVKKHIIGWFCIDRNASNCMFHCSNFFWQLIKEKTFSSSATVTNSPISNIGFIFCPIASLFQRIFLNFLQVAWIGLGLIENTVLCFSSFLSSFLLSKCLFLLSNSNTGFRKNLLKNLSTKAAFSEVGRLNVLILLFSKSVNSLLTNSFASAVS